MIRDINIDCQIAGSTFSIWVKYSHDPGQPWYYDCAPLPESVEIVDMGIVSRSGEGDLAFNADQFSAILETCREAIEEVCLEDAAEVLASEGWTFDQYYRAWKRPRMRRTA
jgi:hypothetical protein